MLEELGRLDDPDQDNITFSVIKVNDASARPKTGLPTRHGLDVTTRPRGHTTLVPEPVVTPLPIPAPAVAAVAPDEGTAEDRPIVVPRRFAALG